MAEIDITDQLRVPEGDEADSTPHGTITTPLGVPIVRKFPFRFNTPNLLTGAPLYTPLVDDILLDAWVEINTPWDGNQPQGDIGRFTSTSTGVFSSIGAGPLDMTESDNGFAGWGACLIGQNQSDLRDNVTIVAGTTDKGSGFYSVSGTSVHTGAQTLNGARYLPVKFINTDPIKVCVSQDGTTVGADPLSTQGEAILYLITVTPV